MRAMILKEFRQLRRDRRTLAMMIAMPVLLLVILGYAASFDVSSIPTAVAGPDVAAMTATLPKSFHVVATNPKPDSAWAQTELRDGHASIAIVGAEVSGAARASSVGAGARPLVYVDGSQLFTAQAALGGLGGSSPQSRGGLGGSSPRVILLYNPDLKTSYVMIPGIVGVILVFVGTVITSLGVVRERQAGTLEQLAVMPLRPADVFLGKIVPYFAVALADLAIVLAVGTAIFGVPFNGSVPVFALGALLFVFVTLGLGVLISSVSQTQGQAIQLAIMTLLPQVLMSGLIFPLSSMVAGVRWIAYLLPLTYFTEISRGVMLRAQPIASLWAPFTYLALLGVAVTVLATLRFRAFLAPAR